MLSPYAKAGALPFSRSLREGGAFERRQNWHPVWPSYSDWAFMYERRIALMRVW